MILVDTSAWVEFLRNSGSAVCDRVDDLLEDEIAICDVVRMELLAGARDEHHLQSIRRLLARATLVPTVRADYENAAMLYRQCRNRGETVRKLVDCLIAAVAIRSEVAILHGDRDFDVLAKHTELEIVPAEIK
ncbi:MAG: PIN domain nuclease [Chloroflexi bacterium]|nr:PIN domain nuclease [Chloroflexota bacterium]MYF79985.1 PIN domain nuclease [Chloroflexota bacterium]MYK61415.1 PIN domain nuclease [Chloroflexota bacterium]